MACTPLDGMHKRTVKRKRLTVRQIVRIIQVILGLVLLLVKVLKALREF